MGGWLAEWLAHSVTHCRPCDRITVISHLLSSPDQSQFTHTTSSYPILLYSYSIISHFDPILTSFPCPTSFLLSSLIILPQLVCSLLLASTHCLVLGDPGWLSCLFVWGVGAYAVPSVYWLAVDACMEKVVVCVIARRET